jgi:hypothetical protein
MRCRYNNMGECLAVRPAACVCAQELAAGLEAPVESVAIKRLIEEVRNGTETPNAYNRIYNRHNRS